MESGLGPMLKRSLTGCLFWLLLSLAAGGTARIARVPSQADVTVALRHAAEAIRVQPHVEAQYDYIMTARVRLLLFWVGKDDVGGGYIRLGTLPDSQSEVIQLLVGSDPAKAPRAINRWGAATEIVQAPSAGDSAGGSSTFLGFMKVSKGTSVSAMEQELAREKQGGQFEFSAIINEADGQESISKVVPFASDKDFTIHQLAQAQQMVYQRLENSTGSVRVVDDNDPGSCGQAGGFLSSVSRLIEASLRGQRTPISMCYAYNGALYTTTLHTVKKLSRQTVKLSLKEEPSKYVRTYENLLRAEFTNINRTTNKSSDFELLLGTDGGLRGVPVQITYEPNWWFDVILNLKTPATSGPQPEH
jgi:hypothetical protein